MNISDIGNVLYAGYDAGSGAFNTQVEPMYVSPDYKEWQYELEAGKTYYFAARYFFGEYTAVSITFGDESTGISNISENNDTIVVYNLNGIKINAETAADLNKLSNGVYIINGKKVMIRK